MARHAGTDASLRLSRLRVLDATGKVVREAQLALARKLATALHCLWAGGTEFVSGKHPARVCGLRGDLTMRLDHFNGITAFPKIAEAHSFSRAAAELGVAPASLSEAVKGMKERLGVRLLNRTTRRIGQTAAGAAYLERVRPAAEEGLALPRLRIGTLVKALAPFRPAHDTLHIYVPSRLTPPKLRAFGDLIRSHALLVRMQARPPAGV